MSFRPLTSQQNKSIQDIKLPLQVICNVHVAADSDWEALDPAPLFVVFGSWGPNRSNAFPG